MTHYLKIRLLSLFRLLKELPFIGQAVCLAGALGAGYALFRLNIELQVKPFITLAAVQLALSYMVATPSEKETVLLLTLRIPLWKIRLLRIAAAAIPFFLINPVIAGGSTCFSLLLAPAKNHKWATHRVFRLPVPFLKSAYRWAATFRREGIAAIAVGVILSILSCIHGNLNLGYVSAVIMICVPCFFSAYRDEPLTFLRVYPTTKRLLMCKITDNLVNSSRLLLLALPAALFWLWCGEWRFAALLPMLIAANLLIEVPRYLCYPMLPLALILLFAMAIVVAAVAAHLPLWAMAALFLALLLLLYLIAYFNLDSVLYGNR